MIIWTPTASKKITLVSDLAAMMSAVADEIEGVITDRQAHTYVAADDADLTTIIEAPPGSTAGTLDDGGIWTHIGGQFLLTHGLLPTFTVRGKAGGTQNIPTGATVTTLSSVWDTPTSNHGFSGWSSGVLTVQRAGVYMMNAAAVFDEEAVGNRYIAIAQEPFTGTGSAFYQRVSSPATSGGDTVMAVTTIANLAAGDTIKVAVWQNSGSTIPTDPSTPQQNQLAVRYLGPN